jgi:hypothetical protein
MTFKPKAADFLQRDIPFDPASVGGWFRLSNTPDSLGHLRNWLQQGGFWMHEEHTSPPADFIHGLYAAATGRVENANLSSVHEGIPLHEFEQMGFHMRADDAVWLDHRAGFRIDIVPGSPNLRLQPPA